MAQTLAWPYNAGRSRTATERYLVDELPELVALLGRTEVLGPCGQEGQEGQEGEGEEIEGRGKEDGKGKGPLAVMTRVARALGRETRVAAALAADKAALFAPRLAGDQAKEGGEQLAVDNTNKPSKTSIVGPVWEEGAGLDLAGIGSGSDSGSASGRVRVGIAGFDLLVDESGRAFVVECNCNPGIVQV